MFKPILLGFFSVCAFLNAQTEDLSLSQIDKYKVMTIVDEADMDKYIKPTVKPIESLTSVINDANTSSKDVNASQKVQIQGAVVGKVSLSDAKVSPKEQHTLSYPHPIPKEETINLGIEPIVDKPVVTEQSLKGLLEDSVTNFEKITDFDALKKEILKKAEKERKLDMYTLKTMRIDKESLKELLAVVKGLR